MPLSNMRSANSLARRASPVVFCSNQRETHITKFSHTEHDRDDGMRRRTDGKLGLGQRLSALLHQTKNIKRRKINTPEVGGVALQLLHQLRRLEQHVETRNGGAGNRRSDAVGEEIRTRTLAQDFDNVAPTRRETCNANA
jgi:hypothetical protein